jgi:hypothetical protein
MSRRKKSSPRKKRARVEKVASSPSAAIDFEKLGAFYLGKEYDLAKDELLDRMVMFDARDLTTHALCVGMTGSGKTGLCIDLLEEAAIDHVPAIIIDPKGDITNLLLTFPGLRPEDFRPWVNEDDARRKVMSLDQYAAQQSELWRNGLAQWGQSGARIKMLRDSVDYVIYTPGSDAGVPVSILQSFAAPTLSWETEGELLRERVQGTVEALLTLVGIQPDPVRSKEHILLSNLFEHFWRQGEDLDFAKLILSVQSPPVRKLGVFDVDTFFPPKDRFELAMRLNSIIAAPSFQNWLNGQPLDIAGFLNTPEGKTRHSVFYIAHLSDAERMFFVTMLLNQVMTWMRTQPGTTSLRALIYMDEIFGFFPPVANPPSKRPMLNLLKQARAFGVGIVLTTQNPVDLDYKGLANAGTWFIGRLQTEQDKNRLLDGLDSASSEVGEHLDRNRISRLISSLDNRVFLLHNVHEEAPIVFQTRWAMSYLRGPLTRMQVGQLMSNQGPDRITPSKPEIVGMTRPAPSNIAQRGLTTAPPPLAPEIKQVHLAMRKGAAEAMTAIERKEGGPVEVKDRSLVYEPNLLGIGHINFVDMRLNVNEQESYSLLARMPSGVEMLNWDQAFPVNLTQKDLIDRPEPNAQFDKLPDSGKLREAYSSEKDLVDYLSRTKSLTLLYSPVLKSYSKPKEDEREFQMRLKQIARERRDAEVDELNRKYSDRIQRLQDRLRRAEASLAKKQADAQMRKGEVAVSVGESLLGMFMGRRSTRAASTAISKYRQSQSASMGARQDQETVQALQREVQELEQELQDQVSDITARWDDAVSQFESIPVRPSRSDVRVDMFALAWAPHWQIKYQAKDDSERDEIVPAYI